MLNPFILAAVLFGNGLFADRKSLQQDLQAVAATSDGKVGVCALDSLDAEPVCINGTESFPMQSVMKLVVGAAVLDAIDGGLLKLDTVILVKPQHGSPGPQDFADLVRKKGSYAATVEELIRRSIVDSDSTSVDRLLEHIGGVQKVHDFLRRKKVEGIRIDRNEQNLQAEFSGLTWQPAYASAGTFEAAVNALPEAKRTQAWEAYLKDPRDTSTPAGMVRFLKALASGRLLSDSSTKKLLAIMEATATGPDRLRAGLPKTWKIGHKTGTSASWKGVVATTNDVGILIAPDGSNVAVAVFVANSRQSNSERAAVIAQAAQAVTKAWHGERGTR